MENSQACGLWTDIIFDRALGPAAVLSVTDEFVQERNKVEFSAMMKYAM